MKHSRTLLLFTCLCTLVLVSCQKDVHRTPEAPTARVNSRITVQLPIATASLSGTGTSNNGGSIVGYLWSLKSGPNVPVIVSPSSPTTVINGLVPGTYIFQFMVIDNLGYTGISFDTVSVIASINVTQTLILKPSNNPNEANITSLVPTDVANSAFSEFVPMAWTNQGTTFTVKGALKFDLSSIPASASIISAKLTLYSNPTPINGNQGPGGNQNPNYGSNNSLFIQRIANSWAPTTLTWNNKPSVESNGQLSVPHTNTGLLDLVDLDVTIMISRMHTINNYGFMISLQNEQPLTIRNFAGSRYPDASKHPKLVITYQ